MWCGVGFSDLFFWVERGGGELVGFEGLRAWAFGQGREGVSAKKPGMGRMWYVEEVSQVIFRG